MRRQVARRFRGGGRWPEPESGSIEQAASGRRGDRHHGDLAPLAWRLSGAHMARYGMVIALKRCIGCNACPLACKQENGTPEGGHCARAVTPQEGTCPATNRSFTPALGNPC